MVGIVILNHNNSSQTLECLKTLRAHCGGGNWKVCVVDNASRPEELSRLRENCGEHVVEADVNGGYARGNNLGCEYFDADPEVDRILILNDDTRFCEDIITPLQDYLDTHPGCGVAFPLVTTPDGTIDKACIRRQKSTLDLILQATSLGKAGIAGNEFISPESVLGRESAATEVPPGSCMMLPKSVFKEIGWFDPGTFLYFEEHIICEKLRKLGLSCILLPGIRIIHLGAATTGKQVSREIYRHWRHSYLHFIREYTHIPGFVRILLSLRTKLAIFFK